MLSVGALFSELDGMISCNASHQELYSKLKQLRQFQKDFKRDQRVHYRSLLLAVRSLNGFRSNAACVKSNVRRDHECDLKIRTSIFGTYFWV